MAQNELRGATGGAAITPSNTTELNGVRALYVGGAGDVAVDFGNGVAVVHVGVPAGAILHIQPLKVRSTGTTATSIVAWF